MKHLRPLLAILTALLLASAAAQNLAPDLAPIPPLKARVTDTVGMLKPNQRAALENKLKQHEDKTGNQVALLIVNNTGAEALEQYGIRVAEAWKVGRKDVGDGVILIVAKDTRKLRLEVGRGAEGVIPDAYAKRIVQDVIAPRFRQNDFYGGLNDGITTIHTLLNKEAFPAVARAQTSARSGSGTLSLLLFFFAPLIVVTVVRTAIRIKRLGNDAAWGEGYGDYKRRVYVGPGWYTPGDYDNSRRGNNDDGALGSGGFGGGFDGGGWSGGGGDFGGGGASGSW